MTDDVETLLFVDFTNRESAFTAKGSGSATIQMGDERDLP
jgi:hypothetical protein